MKRILILLALLVSVLSAQADRRALLMSKRTTAVPAIATDTFNRANANPLDSPMSDGVSTWISGPGALADVKINVNRIDATASTAGARVNAPAFAANQSATITLTGTIGNQGVGVRSASSTDADGYLAFVANSTSIEVYRAADTGTMGFTLLGTAFTVTTLVDGDTITLSANGTTLELFVNGVSQGTRTDSTYSTGQPWVYFSGTSRFIDTFSATDL